MAERHGARSLIAKMMIVSIKRAVFKQINQAAFDKSRSSFKNQSGFLQERLPIFARRHSFSLTKRTVKRGQRIIAMIHRER